MCVCVADAGPWLSCDMERAAAADASCRLRQVTSDNFDWTRIAGRTVSEQTERQTDRQTGRSTGRTVSGRLSERRVGSYRYPVTGPESAIQGRYYIYIEASGQFRDSVAR